MGIIIVITINIDRAVCINFKRSALSRAHINARYCIIFFRPASARNGNRSSDNKKISARALRLPLIFFFFFIKHFKRGTFTSKHTRTYYQIVWDALKIYTQKKIHSRIRLKN